MYICIYNFWVEVFEKTIRCTKMIDHSLERKFYGARYRLCKNNVHWFSRTWRARKVLKWDFCYDAIY